MKVPSTKQPAEATHTQRMEKSVENLTRRIP